jgi:hypothetical protein
LKDGFAVSAILLLLNESNSEVKELHTGAHLVYGEMRIAQHCGQET